MAPAGCPIPSAVLKWVLWSQDYTGTLVKIVVVMGRPAGSQQLKKTTHCLPWELSENQHIQKGQQVKGPKEKGNRKPQVSLVPS